MTYKKNTVLMIVLFCLQIVGCTSVKPSTVADDSLTVSLKQQSALINQQLPVSGADVTLVRSTTVGHRLFLTLYQRGEGLKVDDFMARYAVALCRQPDVRAHLEEGARYILSLRTAENKILEKEVSTCEPAP